MSANKFSEAMGEIDEKYVGEAFSYKKKAKKNGWVKWCAAAACICLVAVGAAMLTHNGSVEPSPEPVETPNPFVTVTSASEMEEYLDFEVPELDKDVESYTVLVIDSYPTMGQIVYADGSRFRIQYGSEDISGIYGGTLVETKDIDGVKVSYYKYSDTTYAIWEENGFSFSYQYVDGDSSGIEDIIRQFK